MNNEDETILFCQLDSLNAVAEYGDGFGFKRFIGVRPAEFSSQALEIGITAITLDVAEADLSALMKQYPDMHCFCEQPEDCPTCFNALGSWFRIEFNKNGRSYYYPSFGEEPPTYLTVTSITSVNGPPMVSFPTYAYPHSIDQNSNYTFSAFEVGQGMCSLIYNDVEGFLIDAGAGTPIKRDSFRTNSLTRNDLVDLVKGLSVRFFLSHGDSDHWRMLGWDHQLRNNVTEYVIPDGLRSIAFFDKVIRTKVRQLAANLPSFQLGKTTSLTIYRTRPSATTSNNNGLVAVFEKDAQKVLAAGDCVYSEMLNDRDPEVRLLPTQRYAAVIVPHHGDQKSAHDVPEALTEAIAFFSAGDHPTYKHPRLCSEDAHKNAGYKSLVNKYPTGIAEVKIL